MHRIQRVPKNSKQRQTSTVTVAVLAKPGRVGSISEDEISLESYNGGGPGGQHSNKTLSGVKVTHLPTGITAKSDSRRSWWQNKELATAELERRVRRDREFAVRTATNMERVEQIGIGDRPSHNWTWTGWRDEVVHHPTGRRWSMSQALKGRF